MKEQMNHRSDRILHWWASITVVVLGVVFAIPREVTPDLGALPFWARTVGGILGGTVAGFYFRMLFECAFARNVSRRALWLVFLVILPVFSSIVYFMTTRSALYHFPAKPDSSGN
jgi:hypothetical protein